MIIVITMVTGRETRCMEEVSTAQLKELQQKVTLRTIILLGQFDSIIAEFRRYFSILV